MRENKFKGTNSHELSGRKVWQSRDWIKVRRLGEQPQLLNPPPPLFFFGPCVVHLRCTHINNSIWNLFSLPDYVKQFRFKILSVLTKSNFFLNS